MVEQLDTEEFAALSKSTSFPTGTNVDRASNVPPVLTKTWFHTAFTSAAGDSHGIWRTNTIANRRLIPLAPCCLKTRSCPST